MGSSLLLHEQRDGIEQAGEWLSLALSAARAGLWEWDIEQSRIVWSDSFYVLFGLAPNSVEPSYDIWLQLVHPEDRARADASVQDAIRQRREIDFEYRILRPDDQLVWINSKGKIFYDEQGQACRMLGIVLDVTTRRLAQEQAREAEEYRKLFNLASDPIIIFQLDTGTILDVNSKAVEAYGHSRQQFIGSSISEITDSARLGKDLDLLHKDGSTQSFETVHRAADGKVLHMLVASSVIDYHGARAVLCINRDVTEHKRAEAALRQKEEQLRQAQKMESMGMLASGIAHDFNNLLTPILGYCDLLARRLPASDPNVEKLGHIRRAAERLSELTHQLLAFSRQQTLDLKNIDLNQTLTRFMSMLRSMVKGVELRFSPGAHSPIVYADAHQLEHAIMNLVTNARDAICAASESDGLKREMGQITIETRNVQIDESFQQTHPFMNLGSYVCILISDNGTGIKEEIRRRIFEPFFTTKEVGQGTGLGLPMTFGIIKQLNGYVNLYSEEGIGTTFKIYLPAVQNPVDLINDRRTGSLTGGKETILVADDDPDLRTLLTDLLSIELGYDLILAEDGEQALRLFGQNSSGIQLVLLDVVMPVMDGHETYQHIRALSPDVPIILVSGFSGTMVTGKLRNLRDDERVSTIEKPYTLESLARVIREELDAPTRNIF